ncbi:MAG: phosphoribosyl-AMP cyclohydrolase [Kiritimatiellae bacterium]|nr:phosphoribosyl-AMP cyclohydrolase [Kiritimatiellia bacterium]
MNEREEGNRLLLDFDKLRRVVQSAPDVIPVAVQHADTGEVILIAYTNSLAFKKAVETRRLILWSTSRNELWEKGATSGHTFDLVEVRVNCEQNCLLYLVRPRKGNICHTRNRVGEPRNCFYRRVNLETLNLENTDP